MVVLQGPPVLAIPGAITFLFLRKQCQLVAALKRRAETAIVIVYAPTMDEALRLVSLEADQTVWLVPEPAPARATVAVAARAKAQRELCV